MDVVSATISKWKPYPKYKDSGVEWQGKVPEHWIVSRLKFCINDFVAGGTPESGNATFWSTDETGIPWVAISDMSKGGIISSTEKRITEAGFASKSLRILPPPTLLYSMYASLGKVAILGISAVTNQAILGLVISEKLLDMDYLKYWLEYSEQHIAKLSSSNTQDNLNAEKVKNINLFQPIIPEQRSIANFLDRETAKIDALISKKEQLIELLQEKRAALISHAVTKGLDPSVPMKDSGVEWLGEIPEHWNILQLRRAVRKFVDYRGATPEKVSEGVPLITAKNIKNGFIDFNSSREFIREEDYDEWMVRGMPEVGDVLLTTEAPLGESAQIQETNIALAQRIILLKANKYIIDNDYLKYKFAAASGMAELWSRATGSTAVGIKASHLREVLITVPPLNEQMLYQDILIEKVQTSIL